MFAVLVYFLDKQPVSLSETWLIPPSITVEVKYSCWRPLGEFLGHVSLVPFFLDLTQTRLVHPVEILVACLNRETESVISQKPVELAYWVIIFVFCPLVQKEATHD